MASTDRPVVLEARATLRQGRLYTGGRRILVLVSGSALCLLGLVLLFLPGPGVPAIFAGLTVLASEYTWADRLLQRLRTRLRRVATRRRPDQRQVGDRSLRASEPVGTGGPRRHWATAAGRPAP